MMYKNKPINILKILLIQSLLAVSVFCTSTMSESKETVSVLPTVVSPSPTSITLTAVSTLPTPSPIPVTATPQTRELQNINPDVFDLVSDFIKNQCMYFEGIVEGNQVVYIQEYKITENVNPILISKDSSNYWVFIDYFPTKSSSLDANRIENITEFFTKDNGKNLPKHTTYIYDASSYTREAEFVVDLNDNTVILNNGFCYIDSLDFTKTKINVLKRE